ncbi:hypothetical protein [Wenjunlia tyrosinilytica]|uniref:Secreted protein n=1 Tax=Wenjunlia tyrosinilytica TaxID=1544741 RepID=A0A918DSQ5_9ACTN|nr:hypothetical protein [Wenjunlia tyrosinilytica]GGO80805.1 hypothetical protein GCM10012280_03580 [Wenjunlia tyrosinilytica]
MEILLVIVALFFVATAGLGALAVVKTKRAVQRGLERHVPQARRMVEDTTLRATLTAKKLTQPGVAGELAALRLSLHTSVDSTRRMLEASSAEDASLTEALALCTRLAEHARAIDGELKLLEREPDRPRAQARLPELRERAERITHSADALRWAAQDRARRFADDDLAELSRQCETEAGALRHWTAPTVGASREPKAFPPAG